MKDQEGIITDVEKSVSSITNVAYSIDDAMVDMRKLINDAQMRVEGLTIENGKLTKRNDTQKATIRVYRDKLNLEQHACAEHLERISRLQRKLNTGGTGNAAEIYNLKERLKNANTGRKQLMAKVMSRDVRIEWQNEKLAQLAQLAGTLVDRDNEIGELNDHLTNVSNATNGSAKRSP